MNDAGEASRLPRSIGGLVSFGLRAWAANAALFVPLAVGVFAAYAAAETIVTAAPPESAAGQFKVYVLLFTSIFADALVTAAVAHAVAARAAGAAATPGTLLAIAIERWLPVIAVTSLSAAFQISTVAFGGLGPSPVPRAVLYVTAPLTWIVWGILGLTGPLVALSAQQSPFGVIGAFARAFWISLSRANLLRLCVLAVVLLLPVLLETIVQSALEARHLSRVFFWSNAPIDALTIGPASAIATVFALDFLRRSPPAEQPPV